MNVPFGRFCESIGVSAHIHRNWSSGKYSHPWLVVNGVGSHNDGKEVCLHESVFQPKEGTFSFLDEVKIVESTIAENIELPCSPAEMYASLPPIAARAVECSLLLCAEGGFEPEMLKLPILAWFVEKDEESGEFIRSRRDVLAKWMTLCERRYEWKCGTNADILVKRLLSVRDTSIGKHLLPIAERFVSEEIWSVMLGNGKTPSPEVLIRWRNNRLQESAQTDMETLASAFTEYCKDVSVRTMKRILACLHETNN